MKDEILTDGSRVVYAPDCRKIQSSAVLSCILKPGEKVEWNWTHTPNGSYVSGYTIKKKKV